MGIELIGQNVDRSKVVDTLIEMTRHTDRNTTFASKEVMETIGESSENSIEDHLNEIERKVKGAIQTTTHIAGDENFRGIEMETVWKWRRPSSP